jgi:hypothetical protein
MILVGYNPYLDIIVSQYATKTCTSYKISLGMHMEENIMELKATYKCSQGKDTLYMYMKI